MNLTHQPIYWGGRFAVAYLEQLTMVNPQLQHYTAANLSDPTVLAQLMGDVDQMAMGMGHTLIGVAMVQHRLMFTFRRFNAIGGFA